MEISKVPSNGGSTLNCIKSLGEPAEDTAGIDFQELIGILFQNLQVNNLKFSSEGNINTLNSEASTELQSKFSGILNLINGDKSNQLIKFLDEISEDGGIKNFSDLISLINNEKFTEADTVKLIENLINKDKFADGIDYSNLNQQEKDNLKTEEAAVIDIANDIGIKVNSQDELKKEEIKLSTNAENEINNGIYQGNNIKESLVVDVKNNQSDVAVIKNPRDIVDVVVTKFKALKLPESTEIRVKLRPEELGEVTIKLVLEKGQINGSILTERREVAAAIQSQMTEIKEQLKDSRVNLNSLTVNVNQEDTGERRNFREGRQNNKEDRRKFIETFEEKMNEAEGFNIFA